MDRERGDNDLLRPSRLALAGVLAVAALLRFWALGHGIPYAVGVDEPEIMARVVGMMKTGDFNPHFFDYPGLLFAVHLPVAVLRFMSGAAAGRWSSLAEVGPEDFYLWARAVTALFGTASVGLTYFTGLRWGTRHALLAAALLAVMPLNVRESHFVLTDVPMTFFVLLTMLLSLSAHERASARTFVWAGAAAGLATSAKYTGGVALLLPLVAIWMTTPLRPSRLAALLGALAGWALAFLATSPYTLLDLPAFLDSFGRLASHYLPRSAELEPGWSIYLKHLRINLGWPSSVLAASGLALAATRAVRGPARLRWTLLAIFPVVFFWSISDRQQIYARYLLPMMPFLCLLAAIATVSGVSLLRRYDVARPTRTALTVLLTAAALLPPASASVALVRTFSQSSTVDVTWQWIQQHIPRGAAIVLEKYELRLPERHYRVRHVKFLARESLEALRAEGVRYLVATSQNYGVTLTNPGADPELTAAYRTLFRSTRELVRVSPSADRPGSELRVLQIE